MNWKNECLVLLGALVGGLVGIFAFKLLIGQGLYALVLPGGLVGMGAGVFKAPMKAVAVVCGLIAIAVGLIAEWQVSPFIADESLPYFLKNFYQLKPFTLIMIALGGAIGFWIPFRRGQDSTEEAQTG